MRGFSNEYNDAFMADLVRQLEPLLKEVGINPTQAKHLLGNIKANHAFRHASKTLSHFLFLKCIEMRGVSLSPKKSKERRLHYLRKNLAIGLSYLKGILRWISNEEENNATLNHNLVAAKGMHRSVFKALKKYEVVYEANMMSLENNLLALKSEGNIKDDGMSFFFESQVEGKVSIQWSDSVVKAQRLHSFMKKQARDRSGNSPPKLVFDSFFWDCFFVKQTKLFYVDGDDVDGDDVDDDIYEAKKPAPKLSRDDDDDGIDENQTLNDLRKESVAKKAAKPTVVAKKKKAKVVVMKSEEKGAFQHGIFNPYAAKK